MLKNRPGEFGFLSVKNVLSLKSRFSGGVMLSTDTIFLTLLYNEIFGKCATSHYAILKKFDDICATQAAKIKNWQNKGFFRFSTFFK